MVVLSEDGAGIGPAITRGMSIIDKYIELIHQSGEEGIAEVLSILLSRIEDLEDQIKAISKRVPIDNPIRKDKS